MYRKLIELDGRCPINWVALFYLTLIGFLFYAQALGSGPVFDDNAFIFKSARLINAPNPWVFWIDGSPFVRSWPLSFSFIWCFYKMFGDHYFYYNLINLLFHIANAFLLFIICKKYFPRAAFLTALIFLIHPMQIETVCWIFQFKTLLATFLFFSSFLLLIHFKKKNNYYFFGLSALLFWISLEAKPVAVLAPLFFHLFLIKKIHPIKKHMPALIFWVLMLFSIRETVLGISFDPYEKSERVAYSSTSGLSNKISSFIENIFEATKIDSNPPVGNLKTDPFNHDLRIKKILINFDKGKITQALEHLEWITKNNPYNIAFIMNLSEEVSSRHLYHIEPFINAAHQRMPHEEVIIHFIKKIKDQITPLNEQQLHLKEYTENRNRCLKEYSEQEYCRGFITNDYSDKINLQLIQRYFEISGESAFYFEKKAEIYSYKKNYKKAEQILYAYNKFGPHSFIPIKLLADLFIKTQQIGKLKKLITPQVTHKLLSHLDEIFDENHMIFHSFPSTMIENSKQHEEIMNHTRNPFSPFFSFQSQDSLIRKHLISNKVLNVEDMLNIIQQRQSTFNYLGVKNILEIIAANNYQSPSIDLFRFNHYANFVGDYSKAYQAYLKLPPSYLNLTKMFLISLRHRQISDSKVLLKKDPKLKLELIRYLEHHPDDFKYFSSLATELLQSINQTNFSFFSDLARKLKDDGQLNMSLTVYQQLIKLRPYDGISYDAIEILIQLGKKKDALELIKKYSKFRPQEYSHLNALAYHIQQPTKKTKKQLSFFPLHNLSFYLTHFLVPSKNSLVYSPHQSLSSGIKIVLTLIIMILLFFLKRFKLLILFFLAIIPVLGFYYVPYMKFSPVADHWSYLAIAPLSLLLVISILMIKNKIMRWTLLSFFILFFTVRSFQYIPIFNDEYKVLKNAINIAPDQYSTYMELAQKYDIKGDTKKAQHILKQALTRETLKENLNIHHALLKIYQRKKNKEEILEELLKIAQIKIAINDHQEALRMLNYFNKKYPKDKNIKQMIQNLKK